MNEDAKIDAIVSLHEHNIAKDKRIAELERQLAGAKGDIENSYLQGFAVPIAALIRDRDLPTIALEIMSANGITISKDSPISEFDLRPILDAARKERE